jgi:hypothetical protein
MLHHPRSSNAPALTITDTFRVIRATFPLGKILLRRPASHENQWWIIIRSEHQALSSGTVSGLCCKSWMILQQYMASEVHPTPLWSLTLIDTLWASVAALVRFSYMKFMLQLSPYSDCARFVLHTEPLQRRGLLHRAAPVVVVQKSYVDSAGTQPPIIKTWILSILISKITAKTTQWITTILKHWIVSDLSTWHTHCHRATPWTFTEPLQKTEPF